MYLISIFIIHFYSLVTDSCVNMQIRIGLHCWNYSLHLASKYVTNIILYM